MEFTDIIIPILMFCVPLLAAVIDARKKALKKLQTEAEDIEEDQTEKAVAEEPVVRKSTRKPLPVPAEEGTHAIEKKISMAKAEEKKDKILSKENIDKKKLILYSEIMKPKFDE